MTEERTIETIRLPGLTEQEAGDIHIVWLEDGRRWEVPKALYSLIREIGFQHGIEWEAARHRRTL